LLDEQCEKRHAASSRNKIEEDNGKVILDPLRRKPTARGGSQRLGDYCDMWDIMSARWVYAFSEQNWLLGTQSWPEMNAPKLLRMG
jgi:hypothetical protein